jgi:hypothetical protein
LSFKISRLDDPIDVIIGWMVTLPSMFGSIILLDDNIDVIIWLDENILHISIRVIIWLDDNILLFIWCYHLVDHSVNFHI